MHINRSLTNKGHSVRLVVANHGRGWEVRREEDSTTVQDVVYNDWHRVERAVSDFDVRAAALREQGWIER